MDEELSDDELKALKNLAQDLMAMGRVRRKMTAALLWLAGIVTASWFLWDKILSHLHIWK